MFVFRQPDQLRTDQRPDRQIEPSSRFRMQDRLQLLLSLRFITLQQVDEIRSQITKIMNLLTRFSVYGGKTGSQHLVANDDLLQASMQRFHIKPTAKPHRARNVVGGAPRLQPIDEPQPLLRE